MSVSSLVKAWKKAGVNEGSTFLLHSSIKRTLQRYSTETDPFTPKDILQSFCLALGDEGTLVLPTFNFDFTTGTAFDLCSTPSHMGALTEAARLTPGAKRSGHPIYSFVAIGKYADKFGALNNFSGYGADSPFAIIRELDGKIGVLDLPDQKSMTFYHHVEEAHEVSYRYHKTFTGPYTDGDGDFEQRSYGIFVRDIEKGVQTHVDPAGELLWQTGLYAGDRPGVGFGLRTISARNMYDFVSDIIAEEKAEGLLFCRAKTSD